MIAIKIPSPGESITEVELAEWLVENGDFVEKDQELAEVESEKATLPLIAEEAGKIEILVEEGSTLKVGDVACRIDPEAEGAPSKKEEKEAGTEDQPEAEEKDQAERGSQEAAETEAKPSQEAAETEAESKTEKGGGEAAETKTSSREKEAEQEPEAAEEKKSAERKAEKPPTGKTTKETAEAEEKASKATEPDSGTGGKEDTGKVKVTPVAKNMMDVNNLSVDDIIAGLRKLTRKEVETVISQSGRNENGSHARQKKEASREVSKTKMSALRRKLSQRLVAVKNETAMLTTFNEIDMSTVMELRKKHQKKFMETHEVKLGFMSFFTKASGIALELFPQVNSMIEDEEIVTFHYADIGIAVQTGKGLMVPVIRNTESMGLADIEKQIMTIVDKARRNRISMEDMSGGTFSITNGGIFGSMLSTPILNPPQAAILGMHNIVERPVAVNGKVEVRPVMYVALTYDHRLIDGKDSVQFLVTIKDLIENPYKMLLKGSDPEKSLLEI